MKRYIETRESGAQEPNIKRIVIDLFLFLLVVVLLNGAIYTVEEGHIGIKKRFSEAIEQVIPGLHFKVPFIEVVEPLEIRTRKNVEKMASSTSEQMPVTVEVSANWTVDKTAALDLYKKYGGLTQFEQRILDPRFRSATKSVIPHYTAEQLIRDRASAITAIEELFIEEMTEFPVTIDSVQIENINLPAKYLTSIEIKQTEKNLAAAEEHKLARQALTAEQAVNTAKATRDATKAKADGKAYAVREAAKAEAEAIQVKGQAEATAIKAKGGALKNNPLLVELTEAQQWDGKLPVTMLGGSGATPILDMRGK
jgi:regulator of protease activity HflC (stomatin/prohibitin superfamily)